MTTKKVATAKKASGGKAPGLTEVVFIIDRFPLISAGVYDILEVNKLLFSYDQKTL